MTYFKFGQKIMANRGNGMEDALAVKGEKGGVFVIWPDCETRWLPREAVWTAQDRWMAANARKIREKRWRKAAEKRGIPLEEYVYAMEQRKARAMAKRDADEKKREYWRKRQQAHREKEKAENDG